MLVDGIACIRDAARELALPFDMDTSVFEDADPLVAQLLAFANAQGQELARDYAWSSLQKKATFTLVDGVTSYVLPGDWLGIIPATAYGSTSRWEMLGSLTPGQWANLTQWATVPVGNTPFRIQGDRLEVLPNTAPQVVTLAYRSAWWVGGEDGALISEEMTAGTFMHRFDRRLMVCAIKNAFTEGRGFDATATKAQYDRALSRAMGADSTPPALEIGKIRRGDYLLGAKNLPDTGWGL